MKVLVIGATRFIGKPLVEKLLERNHEVYVFTRGDKKARRLFGNRVFIQQWEPDQYTVLQVYAHKVHAVINLAGENLGKVIKKPSRFPVPAFLLKMVFGEMAEEMMLQGQKVMPRQLQEMGFEFQYPTLESALTDLLNR